MQQEMNVEALETATCKKCGKEDVKQYAYTEPSNLTRRFRNASGSLWMGKVCPKCYKDNQAEKMRLRRAKPPCGAQ